MVSGETEWARLSDAHGIGKDKAVAWNVEELVITGNGIKLVQKARAYPPSRTTKGNVDVVDEDNFIWQVTFKHGQFNGIHVREYEMPPHKPLFVELRFTCAEAPESVDATVLANGKH